MKCMVMLPVYILYLTWEVEIKGQSLSWATWHGFIVTKEAEAEESHSEACLDYRVSSRLAWTAWVRLCLKMKKKLRGLGMCLCNIGEVPSSIPASTNSRSELFCVDARMWETPNPLVRTPLQRTTQMASRYLGLETFMRNKEQQWVGWGFFGWGDENTAKLIVGTNKWNDSLYYNSLYLTNMLPIFLYSE